jgi:hypothetical protein
LRVQSVDYGEQGIGGRLKKPAAAVKGETNLKSGVIGVKK